MVYKDKIYGRKRVRELARIRNKSSVTLSPPTREQIISETIEHGDWVEAPLRNYKYEIVGYTKLDKDIWERNYKGERLNKSNYGYARHKSDFVHYRVIGKPQDRWTFIDHINRDRLDNRKENLRYVSLKLNSRNSATFGGGYGKGGMRGITFVKGRKSSPWKVSIFENRYKGKSKTKYFKTLEEARTYRKQFPL